MRNTRAVRAATLAVLFAAAACSTATAGRGVAINALPSGASSSISAAPTSNSPTPTTPAPTTPAPTTKAPKKKTTPVSHTCPGAHVPTKASNLHKAILLKSPDRVPTNLKASGSQSLAVLLHQTYKGVHGAAAFLTKIHYRAGYQLTWSKGVEGKPGRVTEFATVYQFAGAADACKFAAWESKNFTLKSAKGLPGLASRTDRLPSAKAFSTEYAVAKGRFVVISGALIYGPKSGDLISRRIMLLQYARI